jgi:hypothetical protein
MDTAATRGASTTRPNTSSLSAVSSGHFSHLRPQSCRLFHLGYASPLDWRCGNSNLAAGCRSSRAEANYLTAHGDGEPTSAGVGRYQEERRQATGGRIGLADRQSLFPSRSQSNRPLPASCPILEPGRQIGSGRVQRWRLAGDERGEPQPIPT